MSNSVKDAFDKASIKLPKPGDSAFAAQGIYVPLTNPISSLETEKDKPL